MCLFSFKQNRNVAAMRFCAMWGARGARECRAACRDDGTDGDCGGLRYWRREPVYPASGKMGLFAGSAPGGSKEARFLDEFLRMDAKVDYWDGEDVD